jgi:hypothetical protein
MFTNEFQAIEKIDIDEASLKEGAEYLDAINRGGLIKPSHLVFVTCVHASDLLQYIRHQPKLLTYLFQCGDSRAVFTESFLYKLQDSDETISLLRATCNKGHDFKDFIRKITASMFNIVAKNISQEINDKIHASKKRSSKGDGDDGEMKRDSNTMRAKKYKSESY